MNNAKKSKTNLWGFKQSKNAYSQRLGGVLLILDPVNIRSDLQLAIKVPSRVSPLYLDQRQHFGASPLIAHTSSSLWGGTRLMGKLNLDPLDPVI